MAGRATEPTEAARSPDGGLTGRWRRLSLATRFAIASGVVLVVATLAIGAVVTRWIEDAVVRNSAMATATYMDSLIAPITQQLAVSDELSPGARRALEEVFGSTPLGERVVDYRFWRGDGRLVWASDGEAAGAIAPPAHLRRAWAGDVVAEFDPRGVDGGGAGAGRPLLRTLAPIRAVWSGEVMAVAEFHEVAPELAADLRGSLWGAWATVALTAGGLGSILYAIVRGGSRTIEAQGHALDAQMAELRRLSARNTELRLRVQAAAARAAAQADRAMRRIGADLHDGPAQHLAYAALRLDSLKARAAGGPEAAEVESVGRAVAEAMAEIRALSRGLQLPDIADRPVAAIVEAAVEAHEARTGHAVAVTTDCPADPPLGPAARVGLFRFVQEGLTNASRHAGGKGLSVGLSCGGDELRVSLRDRGPGLPPALAEGRTGMGLAGLRDRVESLGGAFEARTHPEGGTELTMILEPGAPEWTIPPMSTATDSPTGPPTALPTRSPAGPSASS